MQVTVEPGQGLERHVTVEIPIEQVEKEVLNHIKKLQPKLKMPGFRPGKVPESVVRREHGAAIQHEVADELARQTAFDAIKQVNLEPLTQPSIEIVSLGIEGPLKYTVSFEIAPDFELSDMTNIKLEKISAEVSDKKLKETLEILRKQQATWQEVDRVAANGDKVTIDFIGTINGEAFKGGSATNFELELGLGRMIPGFEDKLIGKKAGDEVTIQTAFPNDYHATDLAGKEAQFVATVRKVSEIILPEVNEEFAKKFGVLDGVEGLRKQLGERLEHELDNRLSMLNKEQVMKKMLELNRFELPQKLLKEEMERLRVQHQMYAKQMGLNEVKLDDKTLQEKAETRVKLGILVDKYAKLHQLTADEDSVKKLVQEEAATYEHPEQMIKWFYEKPERLSSYIIMALENKVVNHIFEHAKVSLNHLSSDEVMKLPSTL